MILIVFFFLFYTININYFSNFEKKSVTITRSFLFGLSVPGVAAAPDGFDVVVGGMFGQLHAQFADVFHNGIVVAVFIRSPDAGVEVFLRKDAVGVERQLFNQVVFFSGQIDGRVANSDGAFGMVDGQLVLESCALFVLFFAGHGECAPRRVQPVPPCRKA